MSQFKAVFFDVFGTLVDWRSSVIRQGQALDKKKNWGADWVAIADEWRSMYQPAMQAVRSGERSWVPLDTLHRESLDMLIRKYNLVNLDEEETIDLNQVWHRLKPWPDTVSGLRKIKLKRIIAPMSNGNFALMTNLSKNSALPWDVILGAEIARQYKPQSVVYLSGANALDLSPSDCLMVAAHNSDLEAASALGFGTAFFPRPNEYGPDQSLDLEAESDWDFICEDVEDLADQLNRKHYNI